jgi:hypothetical protein
MDFAYAFERTGYHTALDNIESLDKRSLQHHGDYALSLAQYFGGKGLNSIITGKDSVFHSVAGIMTIKYPSYWVLPLALITGAVLAWLLVRAVRRGIASFKGIALSALFYLGEILGITIILTLAWWGIDELHLAFGTVVEPTFKAHLLLIGFLVLTLALMIGARIWLLKKWSNLSVALGVLLTWWVLTLLASFTVPGFNPIMVIPLFFALIPIIWLIMKHSQESTSWTYLALVCLSTIVAVVIFCAPVYLLFQAMGTASPGFSGSPSFPIIGVSVFFWVMLLGLLLPHIHIFGKWKDRKVSFGLLIIAGICLLVGTIIPGIDIDKFGLMR